MSTLMTVSEVADQLRLTTWTVRAMVRRGELRGSFIGGRWLIRVEDIDVLLNAHANQTPAARRRRRRAS